MKNLLYIVFALTAIVVAGCQEQNSTQIHLRDGVGSDSIVNNIVTRPVAKAFSALIGEGIEVREAIMKRNDSGFLEVYIKGYNRAYDTKRFQYKIDWIDENGITVNNRTSVWLQASAMGKSPFSLKAVSPTKEAMNFNMDTRN